MRYFLNILIIISFSFSFDSTFGWFTSNKSGNSFKDYISLSATVNKIDDDYNPHFLPFVSGLENASVYLILPPIHYQEDTYLQFELLGSINNFNLDYETTNISDLSYLQGGQFNINIHYGAFLDNRSDPVFAFVAGYESIDADLYDGSNHTSFPYLITEFSLGMYIMVDLFFGIYGTYLYGDHEINDVIHHYDGWDFGIILPSLFTKSIAWQWSYEAITLSPEIPNQNNSFTTGETNTIQLKMMMDL